MTNFKTKSIYTTKYKVSLIQLLKFESRSLLGRLFLNRKPCLKQDNKNLLHLGSGKTILENWVNADFFSFRLRSIYKPDWMLDLRFPLNCDDNVWDGIFTEHTLEHLYPDQALKLLQELYRTIKPGSWLRITVPDLQTYIDFYNGKTPNDKFHEWQTGCEAIRTLTQDYFHLSVWDSILLGRCLKEIGFINIKKVSFLEGTDISLLKDSEKRSWETLYMEAQKPFS